MTSSSRARSVSDESRDLAPAIKITVFVTWLVIIDQLSKLLAQSFLQTQVNAGSFLGLYIGKFPLFSLIVACLALIILLTDLIRQRQVGIGEILILAGGSSNIIDRAIRSGVIDWIPFFGLWFNLADIFITLGVILIIWQIIWQNFLSHPSAKQSYNN